LAYIEELETLWKKNRLVHVKRRRAIRGPNLVDELQVLFVQTKDRRFADCIDALLERGIVDDKWNFVKSKADLKFDKSIDLLAVIRTHALTAQRKALGKAKEMSLSRACAQAAADIGFPAASFEAACKQVELLHAKAPPTPNAIHFGEIMEAAMALLENERRKGFKGLHHYLKPLAKMAKKRFLFPRQKNEKPSQ
jgi:hypothetical protein